MRRATLRLENLEARLTPSTTVDQQYFLYLTNRLRADPRGELERYLQDPQIQAQLQQAGWTADTARQSWGTLTPVPPLAWNDALATSARTHSQGMFDTGQFTHDLPGEAGLTGRFQAGGYNPTAAAENIAFAAGNDYVDVLSQHEGLALDIGFEVPGHRINLLNAAYQEFGAGIVQGTRPVQTPFGTFNSPVDYETEHFGARDGYRPQLVGTVYRDLDGDGRYTGLLFTQVTTPFGSRTEVDTSRKEALEGVTVTATGPGGTFQTTTSAGGGYQLALPAGTYTVTFSGSNLGQSVIQSVTIGGSNVLLDAKAGGNLREWVATQIVFSEEYLSSVVRAAYTRFLNRAPDADGLRFWVRGLQGGLTDERLEAGFIGSAEYIATHGGQGQGWVVSMYHDLLGRQPSFDELAYWNARLAEGTRPEDIAFGFAASREREAAHVIDNYHNYVSRGPRQDEIDYWVERFAGGLRNEEMIAGFVGSDEYYSKHGATPRLWVQAAFRDILHRDADEGAIAYWTQYL